MRKQRWIRMAALAAVLCAAGDAAAQRSESRYVNTDHDGRRVEIRISGEVEMSDDGRGVARMGPGARLTLEEARPGQPDRRMELRPDAGGGVRTLYWENGVSAAPDAADRAWMERMLSDGLRETGVGAEQRVRSILRREGVDGVLREIARMDSDAGKRRYFQALLGSPGLRSGEKARAIGHLGRHVRSDGEKRAALARVLDQPSTGAAELAAVLEAAATIDSDGERASLLARTARTRPLAEPRVRQAFFRAAAGMRSDGELARVLVAALRRPEARDDVVRAAVGASRGIRSDGERARVLMAVPERSLRGSAVRAAVREALEGIRSEGERQRVERRLARVAS